MGIKQMEQQYERYQLYLFVGAIIGVLSQVIEEIFLVMGGSVMWTLLFSAIALLGWGLFLFGIVKIRQMNKESGETLASVMDDERVQQNRKEAFTFGFAGVLTWLVVVMVGAPILEQSLEYVLSAALAANLGVVVGIVASLGKYIHLERQ